MSTKKPQDPIRNMMSQRRADVPQDLTPDEVERLMTQFQQLQSRVEQQESLISSLEEHAMADPLTGLANRKTLEGELNRSLATARRYGRRHALLLVNIDGFSSLNERLGEATANHVLCHVARLLRQNIRPTDIAARTRADNFAVILNELRAIENAEMRATDIATIVARTPYIGEKSSVQISVSIGCTVFGADDDLPDILARADASMLAMKPMGFKD